MIDLLRDIDTQVFLFLNGGGHQVLDPVMMLFSGRWPWVVLYVAIAFVIVRRYGWRAGLVYIAATGTAVGAADFLCASVIRPMVMRLRPANPDNPLSELVRIVNGYRGGAFGFPSCHASNTFALATATALLLRRGAYPIFIFLWAAAQCYSRIYLGVHYPGDILAGATVGILLGWAAYRIAVAFVPPVPQRPRASGLPAVWVGLALTLVLVVIGIAAG